MNRSQKAAWRPTGNTHPAFLPYMYAVICLGLISVASAVLHLYQSHIGYQWLILAVVTVVTSSYTIRIPAANSRISIGDTFFFTNLILYGIPAGIITAAVDALLSSVRSNSRARRLQYCLFNVAALAGTAHIGGLVFFSTVHRGPLSAKPVPNAVNLLFPLAALAFTHYLCNSGAVAAIVALEKRRNVVDIWKDSFLWSSITYFAGAAAAGFIVLTVGNATIEVVGVIIPVVLAMYVTYKTYLAKVQEVRSLAYYDNLTTLPNRLQFEEKLNQALAVAQKSQRALALMFLDLDNFKRINDTHGHGVGDSLLRAVADRLNKTLCASDYGSRREGWDNEVLIGRFGGDEFTILITGIENPQHVVPAAQRILEAFSKPFVLSGRDLSIAASIGISVCPMDGTTSDALLRNADAAMFHAKDNGRSSYQFYSKSMNEVSSRKLALESELRKALERGEFLLYYQPKRDATTTLLTGAEALIRWQHPTRGLVTAAEFIPLAEETGLIRPMGEWTLRTAVAQIQAWIKAGLNPVPVALNVSGVEFRGGCLPQLLSGILRETSLDPKYLELEITESAIMENEEEAARSLRALRAIGVRISIDDFGTGYSSLSRLKCFTLDALKIDQSFVRDLAQKHDSRAITKAIIAMARSLELRVIAEGVETEQQFRFLRNRGCDEIQGWLVGRPTSADEFAILLRNASYPQIRIDDLSLAHQKQLARRRHLHRSARQASAGLRLLPGGRLEPIAQPNAQSTADAPDQTKSVVSGSGGT